MSILQSGTMPVSSFLENIPIGQTSIRQAVRYNVTCYNEFCKAYINFW